MKFLFLLSLIVTEGLCLPTSGAWGLVSFVVIIITFVVSLGLIISGRA